MIRRRLLFLQLHFFREELLFYLWLIFIFNYFQVHKIKTKQQQKYWQKSIQSKFCDKQPMNRHKILIYTVYYISTNKIKCLYHAFSMRIYIDLTLTNLIKWICLSTSKAVTRFQCRCIVCCFYSFFFIKIIHSDTHLSTYKYENVQRKQTHTHTQAYK